LHFRVFDGAGKVIEDIGEGMLTEPAEKIEGLRKRLEGLWPPHELTNGEKGRVISAVASIFPRPLRAAISFKNVQNGKDELGKFLKPKAVLLILDDVWSAGQAEDFDVLGPSSNALITTRDGRVVQSLHIQEVELELLSPVEARRLLSAGTDTPESDLPPEADVIIKEAGRLPLALSLCAGMIRARKGKDPKPWDVLVERFRNYKLEWIKEISEGQEGDLEHKNLWMTIDLSVAELEEEERRRFIELAVFGPGDPIQEVAIHTLWGHSRAMDKDAREELLIKLLSRHLLVGSGRLRQADSTFQMHDLVHAFVRRHVRGDPPRGGKVRADGRTMKDLHNSMLDAYREISRPGWPSGPDDGYFFSHLRDHLVGAGRASELADLAMSPAWLEAKHRHRMIGDALADLSTAYRSLPEADGRRRTLKKLELALRKDLDFIDRYRDAYPQGLLQCLWNRLRFSPPTSPEGAAAELVKAWRNQRGQERVSEVFLSVNQPLPDPLETNLIRVFRLPPGAATEAGQGELVYGEFLDISADGSLLACYVTGAENAIRTWTMETGAFAGSIPLGDLRLSSFRFEPSGTAAVGVGQDGTVRTWDCHLKREIDKMTGPFEGPTRHLTCSSIARNGRLVAVGRAEGKVEVWDRGERSRLWPDSVAVAQGQVTALAFDLRCQRVLVGDDSGAVSVYEARSPKMGPRWAGGGSPVTSLASDGDRVYIGSADGSLMLWNAENGSLEEVFKSENDSIASLAMDHEATKLAWGLRASKFRPYAIDRTIYVKDISPGNAGTLELAGNPDDIRCLLLRGALVAGTGSDWQPRLWDTESTFPSRGAMIYINDVQGAGTDRVIAGGDDGTARIYERRTLAEVSSCRHGGVVWSAIALAETPTSPAIVQALAAALSAVSRVTRRASRPPAGPVALDKTVIAVTAGEGDGLKIWDALGRRELTGIASSEEGTMACRATRDRAHLLFGNGLLKPEGKDVDWSTYSQDLTLWSAEADGKVGSFHVEAAMEYRQDIVVTPDNRSLITALDHRRLGLWSLWEGGLRWAARAPAREQLLAVGLHPSGRLVAAGDKAGNVYLYSLNLEIIHTINNAHHGLVRGLAFTDDGRYLVSGSDDQTMKIWSIPGYTLKACVELEQWVTCLTTSFGLSEVIVGLSDGRLNSVRLEGTWDWGPPIVTAGRRWSVTGYVEETGRRRLVGRWSNRPSATCPYCGREAVPSGAVLEAMARWEETLGGDESPCLALPEDAWKDGRLLGACRACGKGLRWNPFQIQQPGRS
jgi:WD40 repeat protein